jgi:sensor histidine kinase YesM
MHLSKDSSTYFLQNWLLRHAAFWAVLVVIIAAGVGHLQNSSFRQSLPGALVWLPYQMGVAYGLLYGIVPGFLQKKYKTALLLLIAWLIVGLLGNFLFRYFVFIPFRTHTMPFSDPTNSTYRTAFTVNSYVLTNAIAFVAAIPKILRYHYQKERSNQQLLLETHTIELQLLKSQIHPHFLFNTLNNLYSLTQKQSDQAPEIVLKLSGLLHYMLFECNAPEVYLTKEMAALQDYMELERLRYGKRLTIQTHIQGDLEQKKIAPLLLIPFVENAFKHGASQQLSQTCIELQLMVKGNHLFFEVINSKNASETGVIHSPGGGLGLKNVKKRLDLIYPQRYDLTIKSLKENFIAVLKIELD